ncbi:MAG: hypothetical protein WBK20_02990 [Spirochaetota bacterium]
MGKNFFVTFFVSIILLSSSYVSAQEEYELFMPSGKMFFTFSWDLALKGDGIGSKAAIVDGTSDQELKVDWVIAFYSYKNFFIKSGYMFTDSTGAYINAGITERAFRVDYKKISSPSIDETYLYYQQYYHLEGGCRLNLPNNCYLDFGAYYGIQKGDMTFTGEDTILTSYEEAKKGDITVEENDGYKINNDFGITASVGTLYPIIQDAIYFDASFRLIQGLYPAFELVGNTSGDFKWKLYNFSFGLVLGITAVF